MPKTKSTTYIVEITAWKNEKYLSERRNPLACLPACLLTSCQLRNIPREFTEKCFAVFDQSNCVIYIAWFGIDRSYFSVNFLLSFLLWYDCKGNAIRPKYDLWTLRKNESSTPRNVLYSTNEHSCDYLRYVTLLICLLRSVVWFWGVIGK